MEFARSKKEAFVNRRKYVINLLQKEAYLAVRQQKPLLNQNLKLQDVNPEEVEDKGRYQRRVGRLIYLSHIRSYIAFAISMVSQFMHSSEPTHFEAVYKILRYLKGTLGKGILFQKMITFKMKCTLMLIGTDRRSTSGYCSFVRGNLVTWRSKKQNVEARSSAEAEFRPLAHGICESIWI
ncbi:hypothetical protein IC575_004501 [Cucumis melo]